MMFSLNSVLSINWCYFQLIPFLASLPFTAAVPTKYVHNETLISPRLNGQFRIMNCNSVQGNAIIAALQEIVNVAQTAQTRTSNLYDLLNVVNVNFNAFSPLDQSTYDTFETIFGVELFPQSVTSLGALTLIKNACSWLYNGAMNIQGQSIDIWCDSGWETTTDNQGYYYERDGSIDTTTLWDNSGNGIGWINPAPTNGALVCQNPNIDGLAGYTVSHPTEFVSVITLCSNEINQLIASGVSLTSQANTLYAREAESLEDIVDDSFTLLLLHELSHSKALFGNAKTEDWSYPDENGDSQIAYGWEGVLDLAEQNVNNALNNAESLTFFVAAMYLNLNSWWTGLSEPLTYSAVVSEGITFQST